jgi:hypothetical protein
VPKDDWALRAECSSKFLLALASIWIEEDLVVKERSVCICCRRTSMRVAATASIEEICYSIT